MKKATMKVGDVHTSKNYGDIEIVEYINSKSVKIRFINTGYEKYVEAVTIKRGSTRDNSQPQLVRDKSKSRNLYMGKIYQSKDYGSMEVVSYTDSRNVKVRFVDTGYETWAGMDRIKEGGVMDKSPRIKSGTIYPSRKDGDIEVVEYISSKEVKIKFVDTGYETTTAFMNVRRGTLLDRSEFLIERGQTYQSTSHGMMEIVEFINSVKVKIRFVETGYETFVAAGDIRSGLIRDKSQMSEGTRYTTNSSGVLEIVEYIDTFNVRVRFIDTGYEMLASNSTIRSGQVKDKLKPSVRGVGYIGDGEFECHTKGGTTTPAYSAWCCMLGRCYDDTQLERAPTYRGCSVAKEWHNYQNFAQYYKDTYPIGVKRGELDLDKDIKVKGNKVYSVATCTWVTHQVNCEAASAKHYKFTSPDGEIIEIYNLAKFCRERDLTPSTMHDVNTERVKSHKGWKKYHTPLSPHPEQEE